MGVQDRLLGSHQLTQQRREQRGELGADQELTKEFLAMGVDELSVSPGSILPLRKIILETNVAEYKAGKKC